uniref:Late embryogenesis abundant protein n=1 Tax=Kalanchoe fedtschenkoi TaxID=63787 RepID=A0A7N0UAL0_KALFE
MINRTQFDHRSSSDIHDKNYINFENSRIALLKLSGAKMRRTFFCKLISGRHLRRCRSLTHPFRSICSFPNAISSPEPKPYIIPNSDALSCFASQRYYSGGESKPTGAVDVNKAVDEINLKFMEAREDIELALESKETVYFDEEAEVARDAVKEVLDMFQGLLGRLGEDEKSALQRSMGMKIEQLKAELEQLND